MYNAQIFDDRAKRILFQVKVYHPPPPGKGKNAKPAEASEAPAAAPAEETAHSAAEAAKQQDGST